ncbi:uncharacterized protein RSE6_05061 [Rhynchosporium secalis]|uniref:Uncharacterized protein n=1 Tax=Rhynchosporium secalis TaxID=38038 RepID=A0A1E1M6U8_RHYSE|nr:uncharacterized protein RSE6_05061 [Rhynchosporium secalis]
MPPSKRNRGATLAKSPPGSPIRLITKRSQTPESSTPLPLPLRPIRATTTSIPTAFNSSQVDKSESEEEREETSTIMISELNSEEESKSEEEDDITCANEYLDQDLKELGPDRLDREEIDQSDIEIEVTEEFKTSKYFNQSIIDSESNLSIPSKKSTEVLRRVNYSLLISNLRLLLKPQEEDDIFASDSSESDDEDAKFDAIREAEFKAEDRSIKLDDLNDIEFINSGRSELLLDLLIGDVVSLDLESKSTPRTYREVLTAIKEELNNKRLILLPCIRFEYSLIQ